MYGTAKILHRASRLSDHKRIRRMATRKSDYHYLRTNIERSEPRRYASLETALAAMKDLVHLQGGRGFITTREPDGKHTSRHPDGRGVQFWAEDSSGVIVS
jgi:hypothetical protein